jgi:hypothetical protein
VVGETPALPSGPPTHRDSFQSVPSLVRKIEQSVAHCRECAMFSHRRLAAPVIDIREAYSKCRSAAVCAA